MSNYNSSQPSEQNNSPDTTADRASSAVLKLLAIIGLIAILALAAWISVQVIRFTPSALTTVSGINFPSLLSSAGSANQTDPVVRLTLSTTTYDSDMPFTLTWDNPDATVTQYGFIYDCAPGFSMRAMRGAMFEEISCNEIYQFSTLENQLLLVPISTDNRFIDVALSITPILANDTLGGPDMSGQMTLTFVNESLSDSPSLAFDGTSSSTNSTTDEAENNEAEEFPTTTTEVPDRNPGQTITTSPTPAPTQPQTVFVPNNEIRENPNGTADLSLEIVRTGIVTRVNGSDTFFAVTSIPADQKAAVEFVVKNQGDKTMDAGWNFVASLPVKDNLDFEYISDEQPAVRPGDSVSFTVSFDEITTKQTARVKIELVNVSDDKNDSNDSDSVTLSVTN